MMLYLNADDSFNDVMESMVEHEVELLSLMRDSGREVNDEVITMRLRGGQVTDFIQSLRDGGITVLSVE